MLHAVLNQAASTLRQILEKTLPSHGAEWWKDCVLNQLSIQQQRLASEKRITNLSGLDLAALLRVADRNWHAVSQIGGFSSEVRNWLKEAQTIRNRWAHLPPSGLPPADVYRDADTLHRLMKALGADGEAIDHADEARSEALKQMQTASSSLPHSKAITVAGPINKGDLVRLKAQPDSVGAVVDVLAGPGEPRYQVFYDGKIVTYYASQIDLSEPPVARPSLGVEALHAALTALQLCHPSTSSLYSLFASRIHFVPYQFRPVIKLIQADRPRLLIADEVGVGKTIEAGLILKELQARRELRSVLVICPKALVSERKWMEELKRFDEQFVHLDGDSLRHCIEETHLDGVWPTQYSRAILPYSLFDEAALMGADKGRRHLRGLLELDPPPAFDLVIVDEAHHIRNPDTWAYRTARYFCDNAEAVLLLSATPIQLGDNDLYNLLHLLRPDLIPGRMEFDQMAEPNPHLNAAIEAARSARPEWKAATLSSIDKALATPWGRNVLRGDEHLQEVHDYLESDDDHTETRLSVIRKMENLYTFSPLINRTRRRDIGSFTTRKPETVAVEYTEEQSALHHDLIDIISRMLIHRHGDENLKFMLTTVRRQIASCVFGLAPLLESILYRHLSRIELSELDGPDASDELAETLAEFREDVDALVRKARSLSGTDPKLSAFFKVIRDKQKLANNKLLVFSTFRHTLAYLVEKIAGESVRFGLVHGDIPEDERRDLRNRFSRPKEDPTAIDVLLSSEVGCEGLDYQFCDALVNYDLPWNPMRVEQRIGRIDRYGQKSETVVIYNFITPGTVDAEIYERCLLRIGVFRQALGGSEEILGRLTRELREIAENLTLNPEELASRLQQLSDNEVRAIQEQSQLEDEQAKLFGLSLPKRDEDMIRHASSFWLAPPLLANLIARYLESVGVTNIPASFGQKRVITLQIGQEIREKLLADFMPLNLSGIVAKNWERWLKGNEPYLAFTFDQSAADERRELAFITPTHPLARQASRSLEPADPLFCSLMVDAECLPQGHHPFAIYRWRKLGLREDFTFQPVCANPEVASRLLELLENAQSPTTEPKALTASEEDALEQAHYRQWLNARALHIEAISQSAQARLASLKTTHAARLSILEDQRDQASDTRIIRMRDAQIESAKRDYDRRAEELKSAHQRADIIAEPVVFGILFVEDNP
jgi:superfamily II DNA or RNA helicase